MSEENKKELNDRVKSGNQADAMVADDHSSH